MRRHEPTDEQFDKIKGILPGRKESSGVTAKDSRLFVNAVIWFFKTGAPWRDLPERFGNWSSIHKRFTRWSNSGVLDYCNNCGINALTFIKDTINGKSPWRERAIAKLIECSPSTLYKWLKQRRINFVFYEKVRTILAYGVWRLAFGVWSILLSQNTFGENQSDYKNKIVNVASWLWGKPLPTQINFYPLGYHFFDDSQPNNKQYLVGGAYHGFTVGTFISSCNKRIFYEGVFRQVYSNSFISVNYVIGVMEGYHRKCGIIEKIGPILGHDPGPIGLLNLKLYLSKHLSIDLNFYGIGGLAGVSYIL